MSEGTKTQITYEMYPIGYVRHNDEASFLEILDPFRPGLEQLEHFGHIIVAWWVHHHDNPQSRSTLQCMPPYAQDRVTGVFACRSEYRPNPIALSICQPLDINRDQGLIAVSYIDAIEGTPILDLKAYFPVSDRVRDTTMPEWLSDWPEWVEDGHLLAF